MKNSPQINKEKNDEAAADGVALISTPWSQSHEETELKITGKTLLDLPSIIKKTVAGVPERLCRDMRWAHHVLI